MTGTGAATGTTGIKILVVDDDQDFCTSVTALLEAHGYCVVCARSGQEGLAKAASERPQLIILDIMMEHDWAGYEVNQALKFGSGYQGSSSVPILMVSSVPIDPATRFQMAGEVGMVTPDAYLTKPLDIPSFLERVKGFVGGPTVGSRTK